MKSLIFSGNVLSDIDKHNFVEAQCFRVLLFENIGVLNLSARYQTVFVSNSKCARSLTYVVKSFLFRSHLPSQIWTFLTCQQDISKQYYLLQI